MKIFKYRICINPNKFGEQIICKKHLMRTKIRYGKTLTFRDQSGHI